jgi:hypothetical protein
VSNTSDEFDVLATSVTSADFVMPTTEALSTFETTLEITETGELDTSARHELIATEELSTFDDYSVCAICDEFNASVEFGTFETRE